MRIDWFEQLQLCIVKTEVLPSYRKGRDKQQKEVKLPQGNTMSIAKTKKQKTCSNIIFSVHFKQHFEMVPLETNRFLLLLLLQSN